MTSPQPSTSSARQNNDAPHDGAVMMDSAQITFNFGGRTYDADLDAQRLGAQLTRVIQAMSDGKWRTLSEIQSRILAMHAKRDPEASLSARLRDIRKLYGESAMESRRRTEDGIDGLWEYRSNVRVGQS